MCLLQLSSDARYDLFNFEFQKEQEYVWTVDVAHVEAGSFRGTIYK